MAALALAGAGCGPDRQPPEPAPATPIATTTAPGGFRVLVFTRTAGFRHASIEAGVAAVRRLGREGHDTHGMVGQSAGVR